MMTTNSLFPSIARLHAAAIPTGFLSTLGTPFLCRLYEAIATAPGSVLFVACKDAVHQQGFAIEPLRRGRPMAHGELLGFVAGTLDTRRMYRHIVLHHGVGLVLLLLPALLRPASVRKVFETLRYGKRVKGGPTTPHEHNENPSAELLSIAVATEARGMGLGRELVCRLGEWFLDHGEVDARELVSYKVVTFAIDEQSNRFYSACGFVLVRQFMHHENRMNEYLMKGLSHKKSAVIDEGKECRGN
jgi:ribosomal protein S18 acetylase RimI-like enzyme